MEDFDLSSIDFVNNRFKIYKELRDNHPCYWSEINQCWVISRYSDVISGLSDHKRFSAKYGITLETRKDIDSQPTMKLFGENDPPEHLVDRKILIDVINFIDKNTIKKEIYNYLNKNIIYKKNFLFGERIAYNYPYVVLFNLINVNNEQQEKIKLESEFLFNKSSIDDQMESIIKIAKALLDSPPNLKISKNLNNYNKMYYSSIILMSGAKTITGSLLNLIYDIYTYPDQYLELFKTNNLLESFVEESLRLSNTSQYIVRTITENLTLHDQTITKGDSVVFLTGSAQCDGSSDLNSFNIHRKINKNNLAFSYGSHRCPGNALARLELQLFLKYLIENNIFIKIKNVEYKIKADLSTSIIKEIKGVFAV